MVVLLAAMAPFLLNAWFAHPLTDDFCYAAKVREQGFLPAQAYWYSQWTGRYLATALLSLSPLVQGYIAAYKLISVGLLLLLWLALFTAGRSVTARFFTPWEVAVAVSGVLLVYLDQMPDIRSGLYWQAASITYQSGTILVLLLIACLGSPAPGDGRRERPWKCRAFAILSAAFIPGANEVILAVALAFFGLLLFSRTILTRRLDSLLAISCVLLAIGAYLALAAPGNAVRLSGLTGGRETGTAIADALFTGLTLAVRWAGSPPFLLLGGGVAWLVSGNAPARQHLQKLRLYVTLPTLLALLTAGSLPTCWSMGGWPPNRVQNLLYMVFLLGGVVNVAVGTAWLAPGLSVRIGKLSRNTLAVVFVVYLVTFSVCGRSNLLAVTEDLSGGASRRYDQAMLQRYALIHGTSAGQVELPPMQSPPATLYFADLDCNPSGWISGCYAAYFKKQTVVMSDCGK